MGIYLIDLLNKKLLVLCNRLQLSITDQPTFTEGDPINHSITSNKDNMDKDNGTDSKQEEENNNDKTMLTKCDNNNDNNVVTPARKKE